MSQPFLFQKRGKRTLVIASRYNGYKGNIADSSKENIPSLTYKFANLKLNMNHSDSDCEVLEISSPERSQKNARDSKNTYTKNNKFRRPSPKPEISKEKTYNSQRSFRRPSPKTNRFSEFRGSSTGFNTEKNNLGSIEILEPSNNSKFKRQSSKSILGERSLKYTQTLPTLNHKSKSKLFEISQNVRASSPQLIDLTKGSKDRPQSTFKKCTNGFRAPSPTKGRYINLPKLDLLSDEGSIDLKKKCPYCNEPLPDPLPPRIRAYLESPSNIPSLSSINGPSSSIVDQFEFCRLHDAESHIVPDGLQKNYPLVIDFDTLPNRIEVLFPELLEVATGKTKSLFREIAMDAYNELGKARARKPTVVMGRFQKFLPGYYGSKGSSVIFSTLVSLFIESKRLTLNMTKPQEPLEYLNQVLVPETAIRLIAEDRGGIALKEAREIMEDSIEFGMYVHDVEEEDI
ncbi:21983_t:CDS:2 [Cetraspora pellucida]|uniref:Restriction of telomere capping protein 4 n=1 Tax=Cetraspora pellucida TaxID=1433469 RepID=A0A9N9FLY8_9GLOM|nr:21983_t:CDS:2 [Cetraspora pellucida]